MSIISRFFGKRASAADSGLLANKYIESPLSLQVLFSDTFNLDAVALAKRLRTYHPQLALANVELDEESCRQGTPMGMIGWGEHVVQLIGFSQPMPKETVDSCVTSAHYEEALKASAKAHQSHIILYYKGYENNPINQYAAMALVGGLLAEFGAIVVTNETACTSVPATALCAANIAGDILEWLETLPLVMLYCGLVKYQLESSRGLCMRTYGAPALGLPDLAAFVADNAHGQMVFDIFNDVFAYLLSSGAQLAAGHTMQVGDDVYMKLRAPAVGEEVLSSEHPLFVAEFISDAALNLH